MTAINTNPSSKDLRIFAALQLIFFVIIALILWRRFSSMAASNSIIGMSLLIAILGSWKPALMRPIYVGWMFAVFPIGWTVTHLVLGLVYYLLITPIGLLLRVWGHDPLRRKIDPQATTYWIERQAPSSSDRYFRQF
ncbi:MAG: SxtJ family membrane protein [Planctomycetota bacterium]|nr:SxtJ family membrane protein [Planctomycetota bacterium]